MLESPRQLVWACLCHLLRLYFCCFVGFPSVVVGIWLLVVFPSSLRFRPLSTAHSRCDDFLIAIFHLSFDFCFNVLVCDVLQVSPLTCHYHNLAFFWYVLQCPVRSYRIERNVMFHVNEVFGVHHSFLMKSFLCVHCSRYLQLSFS